MYPAISIIVPVYKVEPYLRRCIESILAQTYSHWELILVDDGSPDLCPEICDEYAIQEKRIKVIHKTNGGLSDARNHGLDMATGDYILFVDSDDYVHPEMLQVMVELSKEEGADIVQCGYKRGTSHHFPTIKKSKSHYTFDNKSIFASAKLQITLWAKLYRNGLWKDIRMPVGKIHEDDFTTWKLYHRSHKIVIIDTPYYYYYKNPQGIMANEGRRFSPLLIEAYEERIAYFEEKHEDTLAQLSRWQFCLPLMYLYLRGHLTKKEEIYISQLLHENIRKFTHCSKIPLRYRCAFAFLDLCRPFSRFFLVKLRFAHTIK